MNCRDIEEFAPLYLSGELKEDRRTLFWAHLAQCRRCAIEMDQHAALDARLRDAVAAELPDATAIVRTACGRIREERSRWWQMIAAVAAVVLIVAVAKFGILRAGPSTRVLMAAAKDHQQEVTEHQPRRWRTDPGEIEKLAARYELKNVAALAPPGYRLEHAKMCGLEGQPTLHLVYTNGNQEVSLYVRSQTGSDRGLHTTGAGSLNIASFQNDRIEIIATGGSNCLEFAQFASRAL